jgi:4-aminobutyrate aminotransferase-like enzyme
VDETKKILQWLRDFESRNITFIEPDGSWPIIWERAKDVHVWDANGKKYLDLSAAFGVAAAGHANPRVVRAAQKQLTRLPHAMGDVHPHARKAELARELSRITFERWSRITYHASRITGKAIFCNSGFEAVEAALKTALLATGKPGIIAFEGSYHGLGYGALNVTHRDFFRGPFHAQLREFGNFVPFLNVGQASSLSPKSRGGKNGDRQAACPTLERIKSSIFRIFERKQIGTILVEPVQARGGINIPPPEFLPMLRELCDRHGAFLILDEIYTGFGRTGKWFACEHSSVVPDLICLGKALSGGFPLSACVGRADLMDTAWPKSRGEAIHTSTFLGNPVGCAMALAQIKEIERFHLCEKSAELGKFLLGSLQSAIGNRQSAIQIRGLGLMAGVELRLPDGKPATDVAMQTIKKMLGRGFILLPEGEHANVIGFTPPLTITKGQLQRTVNALAEVLATDSLK